MMFTFNRSAIEMDACLENGQVSAPIPTSQGFVPIERNTCSAYGQVSSPIPTFQGCVPVEPIYDDCDNDYTYIEP